MNELQQRCLDVFPQWLASLPDDARAMLRVLSDESEPEVHRRWAAAALSYLARSIDLIPDGVEELGFLDDAFVLRVAAARALNAVGPREGAESGTGLVRLGGEAALVEEFLGDLHSRLSAFVASLPAVTTAARSVDALLTDADAQAELASVVGAWASNYQTPTAMGDERALVKLRAFLNAKLP